MSFLEYFLRLMPIIFIGVPLIWLCLIISEFVTEFKFTTNQRIEIDAAQLKINQTMADQQKRLMDGDGRVNELHGAVMDLIQKDDHRVQLLNDFTKEIKDIVHDLKQSKQMPPIGHKNKHG